MPRPFDSFVILAEMRTGSNLLEATLNQAAGLRCHGEVFNPHHLGGPTVTEVLGMSLADRIADPAALWARIRAEPGLNGIRFFHDHEPRILDTLLQDPGCAKIVLTRNPVDCYVSLKIAAATKKWRVGHVRDAVAQKISFDEAEFLDFLDRRQAFQTRVAHALQTSGQTAFYLDYDAAQDIAVINGLLAFLGIEARAEKIADSLVRQNPQELSEKVRNFSVMSAALSRVDWADLSRTPNFEPRRGPGAARSVAAKGAPLLYHPLQPFEDAHLRQWLSEVGEGGGLVEEFTQKSLRSWMRKAGNHRRFVVLRHPLARANDAFGLVLARATDLDLRQRLRQHYGQPIPEDDAIPGMGREAYRNAFLSFLEFSKLNIAGQTGIHPHAIWGTQWALLNGLSGFAAADLLCREDRLAEDLAFLAGAVGLPSPALAEPPAGAGLFPLTEIYDRELELAARDTYRRDYLSFGFGNWS